jgi:hypothetical protein
MNDDEIALGDISGKWFAGRRLGDVWCDVRLGYFEEHEYIHRNTTAQPTVQYFDTREELEKAIDDYHNNS